MLTGALASLEIRSLKGKPSIPDWPRICGMGMALESPLKSMSETLRNILCPYELDEDAGDW